MIKETHCIAVRENHSLFFFSLLRRGKEKKMWSWLLFLEVGLTDFWCPCGLSDSLLAIAFSFSSICCRRCFTVLTTRYITQMKEMEEKKLSCFCTEKTFTY